MKTQSDGLAWSVENSYNSGHGRRSPDHAEVKPSQRHEHTSAISLPTPPVYLSFLKFEVGKKKEASQHNLSTTVCRVREEAKGGGHYCLPGTESMSGFHPIPDFPKHVLHSLFTYVLLVPLSIWLTASTGGQSAKQCWLRHDQPVAPWPTGNPDPPPGNAQEVRRIS